MFSNFSLDEFCGSEFWNSNLTWYTDTPELTPCFQKTVLVWVPCLYLWVAALLDAYYILHSKERNIPWNALNINKLLAICLLIVLKSVDLGVTIYKGYKAEGQVFDVDYFSPSVKIITFALAATLLYYNKKYGMRASGVLFFFWLFLTLAGLPQFISAIRDHINSKEHVQYEFITEIVYYIITFILFILNCFADFPPRESPYTFIKTPSPESAAGFPSRLTFIWFDPLALTGFRKSLTEEDLWDLNAPDTAAEIVPKFEKYWNRTLKEKDRETKGSFCETSSSGEFRKRSEPASVLPAICLAFGPQFFCGEVLKITADILVFTSPKLLELIISFIESNEPLWKGYLYAGGLFGCATIQTLLLGQYFKLMYLVGMRIRTALTSVIYKKALRMSNAAKKDSTSGEIINLMAVDAHRFLELTTFLNMVWSAPLQISLSLYFLWGVLGPSVLAGLAGMVVLLPFTGLLATIQKKLEENQMKYNDERVKLMNEILSGIKVLKIYAWEPSFEQQVQAIRDKELSILKKTAYVNAAKSFIWTCSPFIVSLLSFGCFVLVNDTEVLDSKRAFVALSLFNILRFPLSMLPDVISQVIQAAVGIKRINKFMNCDELNLDDIEHNHNESNPITIENGSFTWGGPEEAAVLRNINMEVPRGALVAVVGAVGSGKSSLLAALLAEMTKLSGRVNTTGSVAYVPQQAWIQNATLQDNILFGKPLDPRRYSEAIDVCALRPDFDVLPGGDQTEIGEKGINLSGGQKQRVSLARAVYCGADNYFLDDPLSAVDSHVGKHIFDKVIGPGGLLAGRTRVWVTHNVSYLAQTDLVVVLRDGLVSEAGSYQQLLEKKGAFADFLLHHLSDTQRTSAEELEKLKHDIESKLGSDFHSKLQRARSLVEAPEVSESAAGDQPRHGKDTTPVDNNAKKEINEYNRLIEDETAGTGSVTWAVYKHYLKSIGVKPLMASLLMFLVVRLFLIGSDFWLARWSSDTDMIVNGTVDTKKRDLYLGVYGGLGIGQASATFFADLIFYLACWRAGKIIHAMLLSNILKAPLQFFEVTPVGRILNRFSKDIGTLDSSLIWQASNTIGCAFELLGSILVISYSTPMFTSVVVPIGAVYFLLQRYFVATSRQLTRLEAISSSPIYSHFGETIAGASTIRAYGVTRRVTDRRPCAGINLSGGQKQRVSLARAVYCGADNYFLDDPLSAVDSHVGKHIFDKVIGPGGLLAGRTRVWVTHNVSYLAQTDLVVVLRDGLVSEAGSYQQLLEKKGAFADFLLHHLSDTQRTSAEELEKLKHDIESKLGSDFHSKLQRARSLVEAPEVSESAAGDQPRHGKDTTPVDNNAKKEINEYNRLIEDETAGTGSVTWAVYKHYLKSIGVKPLMASLLMFLVVRLFLIGSDFWLARWSSDTDMIVNGTVDTKKRDLYLGVYGGLGIGQASATFFADLIFYLACWRAGKIIHAMLLSNILKAPLQFFEVTPVGRILNRFSKDIGTLDSSLIWQASNTIGCAFELLGSILVISYSTPMFTSVVVPIGAVYFLLQRYFVATSRQLTRLEAISSSPIYSHFGETIAGASTIRAYGVTRRFIGESEAYVDRNQSMHYPSCIADRWLGIRLETVGNLVILFASLFAVLARGSISPGLVGLSITYSLEVTMTLNWMVRMISEVESNIVAVERIKEYADVEQEAAWIVEPSPVNASWPSSGALRLEQVSLGYRAGEPALRDVTCAVAPRDKLGIVGRTGAGKSTLTLGLFRIVEALRGRILIDGVDIASLGLHQLRARITIIPQDPVLFSGTLRTNLDPFGAHSDDDIWRALEHAHLKTFVNDLGTGLQYEVTEGGENLSVGQRQLVCLARALLRKTPLLVLDEATAAVDLETDELIQKTIRSEFASCTVLTIAHRLNTILDCTKVMVLDKGQLVEYAPPDELLRDHSSLFYSMAKDAGLVD